MSARRRAPRPARQVHSALQDPKTAPNAGMLGVQTNSQHQFTSKMHCASRCADLP